MVRIVGTYVQNRLQGRGRLVTQDKQTSDCFFRHGSLHGPLRRFKLKKFREFRQQLDFVGTYRGGKPSGVCWQYREGGGWLVGAVDSLTGEFTANTGITYIYPDFYTALTGAFRDGVMTGASATHLIDVEPDTETQILTPLFAPVKSDEPIVAYSKATTESIGDQPMIADPYESRTVEVKTSHLPGSGEGLFARRPLPKGTITAFYNGIRLPYKVRESDQPKEEWSTSGYKIYINADYESGERMDIPAEYISVAKYRATLGHKLNHSFRANCEEWFLDHPRFGIIPCERTNRDVEAGEEVFLDYGYDPYNCPQWFSEELIAFKQSMTEEEEKALSPSYASFVV